MKIWHWIALSAVIGVVGYRISLTQQAQTAPSVQRATQVVVAPVKREDFKAGWQAVGRVVAKSSVDLKPRVEGQIAKILFKEGALVTAGQVLIELDDSDYRNKWQQAKAVLAHDQALLKKAQADLARATVLLQKKFISDADMNSAQATEQSAAALVQQDNASLDIAARNLEYTHIKAPFSGRVGAHLVSVGATVQAYSTVLTSLNQLDPIAVSFTLPEKNLGDLQLALRKGVLDVTAQVNSGSLTEQRHGQVSFLDNNVDSSSGSVALKADFANPHGEWLPGQYVTVKLAPRTLPQVLVVPSQALQQGPDGLQLFVVIKGIAQKVAVEELAANDGWSAIQGDLQQGDQVVTEGQFRLNDGSPVTLAHKGGSSKAVKPAGKE
ncbi:efflux RND transporter periplasmic adaptor subunit [uncultured Tolumonas sp.]|uniref:efflux RND transporter periplasmic adaptor subunit n=1 Tax=uncultured Tolumonas sp. TaxID=263765 RepID=UPI002930B323|nr:efflux RND transporter periplasmic adaptor subunit [uncultured Tolumonas sp.]